MTSKDLQEFEVPDNLHSKSFVFSPDSGDTGRYRVVGYCKGRDKSVHYDILFDNLNDPIRVVAKEMMELIGNSLLLSD